MVPGFSYAILWFDPYSSKIKKMKRKWLPQKGKPLSFIYLGLRSFDMKIAQMITVSATGDFDTTIALTENYLKQIG